VNISSHDYSQNTVASGNAFIELKEKIKLTLSDDEERSRLLARIEGMEKSTDDRSAFASAYQRFIASAANHMTLIAPFLPAITKFLG